MVVVVVHSVAEFILDQTLGMTEILPDEQCLPDAHQDFADAPLAERTSDLFHSPFRQTMPRSADTSFA